MDKRIIIIGASGTIGRQLFSDSIEQGFQVIGTSFSKTMPQLVKFDITRDRIADLIPDLSEIDCVYLLSAYINPNWVYANQEASRKLNVDATIKVIDDVFRHNVKLVFVSTELVFDGIKGGYTEIDLPNPTSLYGKQKAEVEEYMRHSMRRWCLVRTGATISYHYGDNCPIMKTYKTILSQGAKIASDNIFTLTDVRDTSLLLIKIADRSITDIYHAVSSPPVSRLELARWIKENSRYGGSMSFEIVPFNEIPYPETRPKCSWLSNRKVVEELGVSFIPPLETVRQKVALIDRWYAEGKEF